MKELLRVAGALGHDGILLSSRLLTTNGLKKAIMRRKLSMHIKCCRKIYASFLRERGVQSEIVDMLQGRIGKNILLRHYMTPCNSYRHRS